MEVRFVSSNGCISWKSEPLFVATPLAGEHVELEEVDDGVWTLYFAAIALPATTSGVAGCIQLPRLCGAHRQLRWLRA